MYRTVAQLESQMQSLATWFPAYFTRIQLPEASVQGRPVFALRLRAGTGPERRGVLLVGGTHARELMNPDAIIELAVDLFVSYRTRLFSDKIRATFQLNVKNVGESGGGLQPTAAFFDGLTSTYRIVDPRQFLFSAMFDF